MLTIRPLKMMAMSWLRSNRAGVIYSDMKPIALAMVAAFALVGCATQKIDWPARVGNYTHDQAVKELGPPDKEARLTDGTVVAEWLTQRGHPVVMPGVCYVPPGRYFGHLDPVYSEAYVPDYYLRLTFGTNAELKAWTYLTR
jgi:hypothetical protein